MNISDSLTIRIDRLKLRACIGVLPIEKQIPQEFEASLEAKLPYDGIDDISATMNYAEVCEVLTAEAAKGGDLIEHVARRMLAAIGGQWPQLQWAELTLAKLAPPMPFAVSSVSARVSGFGNDAES